MPVYEYYCEANGQTVDVVHGVSTELSTWLEVCYVAQQPIGDTDPLATVRRVFTRPPGVAITKSNAELRDLGFKKLVKREDGVYEDLTARERDSRIVNADD